MNKLFDVKNKLTDEIIKENIHLLQGFRKMFRNPKTEMPYMNNLCSGLINISPLHRAIFKEELNNFFLFLIHLRKMMANKII